jgi:hypothetical protein
LTTFHTDPEKQFDTVMRVRSEVFPEAPYPNWTAVGATWLSGFDFEIKVIARIPEQASPSHSILYLSRRGIRHVRARRSQAWFQTADAGRSHLDDDP